MKRTLSYWRHDIALVIIMVVVQGAVMADPPRPHSAGGHGRGNRSALERPGRMRHLERWLERMAEKEPEEYERLVTLRAEAPEAFRDELRGHLRQARSADAKGRQRDDSLRGPRRLRCASRDVELAGELAPLIEHFRQAGTPEERARIKEDGRRHLEELFDEQTERHRQRIAEAEQHLEHLRELLELRINRRQRIIDRQADSLFDPNG